MLGLSHHSEQEKTDLEHATIESRLNIARHLATDSEETDDPDLHSFAEARRRHIGRTLSH